MYIFDSDDDKWSAINRAVAQGRSVYVDWETLTGKKYAGYVTEVDNNVLSVVDEDGKRHAVECDSVTVRRIDDTVEEVSEYATRRKHVHQHLYKVYSPAFGMEVQVWADSERQAASSYFFTKPIVNMCHVNHVSNKDMLKKHIASVIVKLVR